VLRKSFTAAGLRGPCGSEPKVGEAGVTGIEPIDFAAAYEVVTERIRRAIHIGSYLPGDKLPPERSLAQQLGVSRTTVREAIRVLEGEGYVVSRRGASGGIIVLDQAENEERLRPLLAEKLPEIEEGFDYRVAVEGAAARLAAERRTDEDLAILQDAYDVMRADRETQRFRAADNAFHLAIADAARNRLMRQAIEDARAEMWVPIDRLIDRVFTTANRHHKQILDAIRDRDPDAAQKAVVDHLETARRDLRRALR
jgi:GntR family transcriptional regulator, transcriptional repressor for pyruvate dehydrogenase complex